MKQTHSPRPWLQITASAQEQTIKGSPSHAFPSHSWVPPGSMHLSTQLNVYLDTEDHILTWGQWQIPLGQGEETLVSRAAAEITAVTQAAERDAFSLHCLKGLRSKKNERQHYKRSLASCSKPKAKLLRQARQAPPLHTQRRSGRMPTGGQLCFTGI